jgi:hypothetical protein
MAEWIRVSGVLVRGYRVASGPSKDYPYGALDRQRPFFQSGGLDLSKYFNGTLNIDIRPFEFQVQKPEFTFHHVEWTDLHPPSISPFQTAKSSIDKQNTTAGCTIHTLRPSCATSKTHPCWR